MDAKLTNFGIEKKAIFIVILIFIIISLIEVGAHFLFFVNSGIMTKYWIWFLYLNISISIITGSIWHFFSYKTKINCMTGMMIGMTLGMQVGMMIGAVIGATNGFFIGAMVGVIFGVGIGLIIGVKSKTTMGILQGMMSGIMGGTMGPMISVMMFFDHLKIFMPIYIVINVAILVVMSYMFYEESIINNKDECKKVNVDVTSTILISVIITIILVGIILFLPRSVFLLG